ncbi:MAG: asparagine synthase-related protein [Candidatus Eisenbacteria bacterium]
MDERPGGDSADPQSSAVGTLLDRIQRHDLETSLAEGLLTKSDRAGMRSALELRPVPGARGTRVRGHSSRGRPRPWLRTKAFLKEYALRYLPKDIVHRRKRGLSIPLSQWLRGPLRDWAASRVGDGRLAEVGLDPAAASDLLAEHEARKADHARALWSVIVLDEWLRWRETQAQARVARDRNRS